MIVTVKLKIGEKEFVKTCSDSGFLVERDGVQYEEAIDPAELGRTYVESDLPIGYELQATESDYQNALREMGVEV